MEMTHDLEVVPFSKEDTAEELQAVENAEVAVIKTRGLPRFDPSARSDDQDFDSIARLKLQQSMHATMHTNTEPSLHCWKGTLTSTAGIADLAEKHNVFIAGDDFKSEQTKMKSSLVEFFVGATLATTTAAT